MFTDSPRSSATVSLTATFRFSLLLFCFVLVLLSAARLRAQPVAGVAPLVTAQVPGAQRSDFFGFVGFKFTVGTNPVTVTELGRFFLDGNNGTHVLKLVNAATDVDLPNGAVSISMAGGVLNEYKYAALPSPVVLAPNTSYYLVSEEAGSQDLWSDLDTTVSVEAIATCDGAVFVGSGFPYTVGGGANHTFGPVNLKYSLGPSVLITSPASGANFPDGSNIPLVAATGDFSANISKVEFFQGTTLLGEALTAPYQLTWNSVPPGEYQLTAVLTDNQGLTATSAVVSIVVLQCDVSVTFLTGTTLGTLLNNFSGPVGMKITVGASSILVTELGRLFVDGNTESHTVKVVRASDETDVPNASVSVAMTGGVDGQFIYAALERPVVLAANTAYYLVSVETGGGDHWYNANTTVTARNIAHVDGGAFRSFAWDVTGGENHSFVPVDFKYAPCGVTNTPPQVTISVPAGGAAFVAPATVTIDADASDSDGTVTNVQFFANGSKIGEDNAPPYSFTWSNASANSYDLTARVVDNEGAAATSAVVNIVVDPAPAQLTVSPALLAFGNVTVGQTNARTFMVINSGGLALVGAAVATAPFTITGGSPFNVAPGQTGTVTVAGTPASVGAAAGQAIFTSNGGTATNNLSVTGIASGQIVTALLTVTNSGAGTIQPNLNGQLLQVGRTYTMTATPAAGSVFSNWTGGILFETSKLTFRMEQNLTLQANFIRNPFVPVKGAYNGLFSPADGITVASSGFATFIVTDRGTYTAKFQLAGKQLSLSGQFNLLGQSTKVLARTGNTPLTVGLQLDLRGGDQITGHISDGIWTSDLTADRAFFAATNPATAYAGKFRVIFASNAGGENARPVGNGFGTVTVTTLGQLSLTATLGDGTAVSQRVPVSKNGQWPLFASPYRGLGVFMGWMTLVDRESDDIHGHAGWIRLAQPTSKLYPAGFTNDVVVTGSRYVAPAAGTRAIDVINAVMSLTGGNLIDPVSNDVTLGSDNKVTNLDTNKLTLTLVPTTGLFSGSVQPVNSPVMLKFKGALLQKQDAGWGFFVGTNQTGPVYFGPAR